MNIQSFPTAYLLPSLQLCHFLQLKLLPCYFSLHYKIIYKYRFNLTIIQFPDCNRDPLDQALVTTDKRRESPMQRTGSSIPLTNKTGLPQKLVAACLIHYNILSAIEAVSSMDIGPPTMSPPIGDLAGVANALCAT